MLEGNALRHPQDISVGLQLLSSSWKPLELRGGIFGLVTPLQGLEAIPLAGISEKSPRFCWQRTKLCVKMVANDAVQSRFAPAASASPFRADRMLPRGADVICRAVQQRGRGWSPALELFVLEQANCVAGQEGSSSRDGAALLLGLVPSAAALGSLSASFTFSLESSPHYL